MDGKPNFILCMCDELRAFEVGCYGNPNIRTPNVDRLAAEGVRFDVAVSNNPVCMPARSAALAGQYGRTCSGNLNNTVIRPVQGGWIMPQWPFRGRLQMRDPTLPEILRESGYETAAIGKWHIEAWPDEIGFDRYLIPEVQHAYTNQRFCEDGGPLFVPEGYSVDYEAGRVAEFLSARRTRERPFFLFYNISPPHMPLADAPVEYREMYDRKDVVVRPNVDLSQPLRDQEHKFLVYLWDYRYYRDGLPYTRNLPPGTDLLKIHALYMGLITWVDAAVGRMMEALDRNGLADDTVLVFTSDHGDNMGSFGRMGKCSVNEEAIRIPLCARGPGIRRGWVSPWVASLVDLAPTFLDLAGTPVLPQMQGRSLAAALAGDDPDGPANMAFIETDGDGCAVRSATHLLGLPWKKGTRDLDENPRYFFDLRKDPYELNNQAASGDRSAPVAELEEALRRWNERTPWREWRMPPFPSI